jgi:eukaryotic-like serine/threonine-protein kinase
MTATRPSTDFEIMGELGQTGEGPAFLARDRSTHELVAVRPAGTAGGLAVMSALNSAVPAAPRNCPICRTAISDWRRFCDQCGADLSGVDVAPEGLDARQVVEEVLRISDRPVDLLGPMKRSEGGGDVWFGCDRQTGEILALNLKRGAGPGRAGGYSVAVTAVLPASAAGPSRVGPPGPSTSVPGSTATPPPVSSPTPQKPGSGSGSRAAPGPATSTPNVKLCPSCGREYAVDVRFCPDDGSVLRLRDAKDTLVGQIVADRYLIHRKIGQGGMGQVYQAEHVRMGQKCAIKVLSRELSNDVQAVSRFAREATNASRINDIHVAHIYDFGESPEHGVYLAMEYVEGEPLGRVIAATGSLSDQRTIDIATQVAAALEAAHGEGVVHRDLTPNNIMIARSHDGSDLVKVVDFGIAKATDDLGGSLTRTGFVIGTPQYMSPEQLLAEPVDGRSDIYQLGCVMFEMLTGVPPFGSSGGADQITKRLTGAPPRPIDRKATVGSAMSDIVTKALARPTGERYQTARDLRAALLAAGRARPAQRGPGKAGEDPAARREGDDDRTRVAARVDAPSSPPGPAASGPESARTPADAETKVHESPLAPPSLSGPRRAAGGPSESPPSSRPGAGSHRSRRQKAAAGTGATDVTRVAAAVPGSGSPQPGTSEEATVIAPRASPTPEREPSGSSRSIVRVGIGLVAVVALLTLIGTLWSPIRLGPLTFGFGGTTTPGSGATPVSNEPPGVSTDPTTGQTAGNPVSEPAASQAADNPVPEPTGIRLGSTLPEGALILADGERSEPANGFIALPTGEHQMEVRAPGYTPIRARVTVDATRPAAWSPRLERLPAQQAVPTPGRRADSPPVTLRDTPVVAGAGRSAQAEPPPVGQSGTASLPVGFSATVSERIESFRQALAAKDLGSVRRYLTQDRLREFGDVFNRSGSSPIRVSARDIAADSTTSRATFLLRIDAVGGGTLLPFGEFVAEFQRLNGAWQLFAIDRRQ